MQSLTHDDDDVDPDSSSSSSSSSSNWGPSAHSPSPPTARRLLLASTLLVSVCYFYNGVAVVFLSTIVAVSNVCSGGSAWHLHDDVDE